MRQIYFKILKTGCIFTPFRNIFKPRRQLLAYKYKMKNINFRNRYMKSAAARTVIPIAADMLFFHYIPSSCAQSSTLRPSTRSNSLVLFVTRISPSDLACPAISKSIGPIGIPFLSSCALILPYSSAAGALNSKTVIGERNRKIAMRFFPLPCSFQHHASVPHR